MLVFWLEHFLDEYKSSKKNLTNDFSNIAVILDFNEDEY